MSDVFRIHKKGNEVGLNYGAEWFFNKGGRLSFYFERFKPWKLSFSLPSAFVFLHRFAMKGDPQAGTEKEFVLRFQYDFDTEPKFNLLTIEFVNPFEARWFYVWLTFFRGRNLKVIFNFGWRLTLQSKKNLEKQLTQSLVQQRQSRFVNPNEGVKKPCLNPKPTFEVR